MMKQIKKALLVALSFLFVSVLGLAATLNIVETAQADGAEVYFVVNTEAEKAYMSGSETDFNATHSGIGTMTHGDGTSTGSLVRKINNGQYVEYTFDLDDSITSTVLKVTGELAVDAAGKVNVTYSVNGTDYSALAIKGAAYKVGTYYFELNEQNALSGTDNKFNIRINSTTDGMGVYSICIGSGYAPVGEEGIVIDALSYNYSVCAVDSVNTFVWLDNDVTPLYYMLGGGYTTFAFDLPDAWTNATWSYTRDAAISVLYSENGTDFTAVPDQYLGSFLKNNATNTFYLKVTASANSIFEAFTIAKSNEPVVEEEEVGTPGIGANVNTIPADSTNVTFFANTEEELKYAFSSESVAFADTHSGFTSLNMQGGTYTGDVARSVKVGECLVYEFDLADSITAATLKLYGTQAVDAQGVVAVEYSVDGENYSALSLRGSIYKMGTYFFDLTEANALSGENNKFRIKITGSASLEIRGVAVISDVTEITGESVIIADNSAEHLMHVADNKLEFSYFFNGAPVKFLLGGGYIVYYFDLPDAWTNATWSYDKIQSELGVMYSTDNVNYVAVTDEYLGSFLKDNATNEFYLKAVATGDTIYNNFKVVKSDVPVVEEEVETEPGIGANVNIVPADSTNVTFFANTEEELKYAFSSEGVAFADTHSGFTSLNMQGGTLTGDVARNIKLGECLVYEFDLADSITAATLKLYGYLAADAQGMVTVEYSVDGETYAALPIRGSIYKMGTYFYDLTQANALSGENNKFRIKITGSASLAVRGVAVISDVTEITGESVNIADNSAEHLMHVADNKLEFSYFFNGAPVKFLLGGGYIVYHFNLPDAWTNATWSYDKIQSELGVMYSTDNVNYVAVTSEYLGSLMKDNAGNEFYLKLIASGDTIYNNFKITKSDEPVVEEEVKVPGLGENTNTVPADVTNAFFFVNTAEEAKYVFSSESVAFADTHSGFTAMAGEGSYLTGDTARSIKIGECLVYEFDLADSITSTTLKIYGNTAAGIVVEYSVDGGETYTALSLRGSIYKSGTLFYDLTEANALSGSDNKFRVKISSTASISVMAVAISTTVEESTEESIVIEGSGEEHIVHLVDNKLECAYYGNNTTPYLFTLQGGYLTYYYDLPDAWTNVKVTVGGDGALALAYSENGTDFVDVLASENGLLGKLIKDNAENRFYLKFIVSGGNAFNTYIKIEKSDEPVPEETPDELLPGQGTNLNEGLVVNGAEAYFLIGTEAENGYKFYNESVAFDTTHRGIYLDDANGGWASDATPNARRLDNGDYLVYEFDMADGISTGVLKLYGSAALNVEYSVDGVTYAALSARFLPYNLGYHVYDLSEANALSGEGNKFRIKISSSATCYLNEMYVRVGEADAVESSLYLATHSYDFIKYLESGSENYTYISYGKTAMVFFVGQNKEITFKLPLASGVSVSQILSTLVQNNGNNVVMKVSADGETYTDLFTSEGGGGTPPTQSADVSGILANAQTVWVKVVAVDGQSFMTQTTVCVEAKDVTTGSFNVFTAEEGSHAVAVSGSLFKYTFDEAVPFREVYAGQSLIYKIDFADETKKAQLSLSVNGPYGLYVSTNGSDWTEVRSSSASTSYLDLQSVYIYDQFDNNDGKVIYVKVTALGDVTRVRGLSYTTENVPSKPIEDFVDKDDDMEFDYSANGTPDYFPTPELPEDPAPVISEAPVASGCGASAAAASLAGVIALLGAAAMVVFKNKK